MFNAVSLCKAQKPSNELTFFNLPKGILIDDVRKIQKLEPLLR